MNYYVLFFSIYFLIGIILFFLVKYTGQLKEDVIDETKNILDEKFTERISFFIITILWPVFILDSILKRNKNNE